MKDFVKNNTAGIGLLILLSITLILHLLILAGIIPYNIFWGGQMENEAVNIVLMELFAVVVLLIFMGITILKTYYPSKYPLLAKAGMWIVFAYLLLNTAGNLSSEQIIEKAVLTPTTFLMSLLALRLAISQKSIRKP